MIGKEEQSKIRAEEITVLFEEEDVKTAEALKTDLTKELNESFAKRSLYYETVLQKRLSILKRIHLAVSREKEREKVRLVVLF